MTTHAHDAIRCGILPSVVCRSTRVTQGTACVGSLGRRLSCPGSVGASYPAFRSNTGRAALWQRRRPPISPAWRPLADARRLWPPRDEEAQREKHSRTVPSRMRGTRYNAAAAARRWPSRSGRRGPGGGRPRPRRLASGDGRLRGARSAPPPRASGRGHSLASRRSMRSLASRGARGSTRTEFETRVSVASRAQVRRDSVLSAAFLLDGKDLSRSGMRRLCPVAQQARHAGARVDTDAQCLRRGDRGAHQAHRSMSKRSVCVCVQQHM